MTGVTKTGMFYPVCGMVHIKHILLLNEKRTLVVAAACFLSHCVSGPLPCLMPYTHVVIEFWPDWKEGRKWVY